jgi:hypothetical protein
VEEYIRGRPIGYIVLISSEPYADSKSGSKTYFTKYFLGHSLTLLPTAAAAAVLFLKLKQLF